MIKQEREDEFVDDYEDADIRVLTPG